MSFLGILSILNASTTWVWTIGMLAALAVSHHLIRRQIRNDRLPVRIRLFEDGTACLMAAGQEVLARIEPGGWSCRVFCVIALREPIEGRRYRYLACASNNHPDDYRRLLMRLRMATPANDKGLVI